MTTPPAQADETETTRSVLLFLCGDVMLGRGIDQILARPGDPHLHEPLVHSAIEYVELAEAATLKALSSSVTSTTNFSTLIG